MANGPIADDHASEDVNGWIKALRADAERLLKHKEIRTKAVCRRLWTSVEGLEEPEDGSDKKARSGMDRFPTPCADDAAGGSVASGESRFRQHVR